MEGFSSHLVPGQRKYDMIIEHKSMLIKVQVKTSTYAPKKVSTQYQLQRRIPKLDKYIVKPYKDIDFDLFCFVEPNKRLIAFILKTAITNKCILSINHNHYKNYTLKKAIEDYESKMQLP